MKKIRTLVVEDEAIVGMDIRECLEELGYEVIDVVGSGETAIETAKAKEPSIVLMDIVLEGKIDGIAAAAEVRKLGIPVIFVTAHADQSTLERAKVTEPYGYILKPIKQIELRTVIELALYRHGMEQRRAQPKSGDPLTPPIAAIAVDQSEGAPATPGQTQEITRFLRSVAPLNELQESVFQSMAPMCRFQSFKGGDFILFEADAAVSPFLVMEGRAALVKSSANGKDLIVEILAPQDPASLLMGLQEGASPFSIKAQVDCKILWIPRQLVTHILDNFPDLSRKLVQRVLDRLRHAYDLSRALAHDRVEVRVASALLAMIPQFASGGDRSGRLDIKMSRQELADMTGTAPETASRVANALERENLVDLSRPGFVAILNRDGLAEMLEA